MSQHPRSAMPAARILIMTGDGKGKTTAALGLVLRASGHGLRALVLQFIKHDARTGELAALRHLPGVDVEQTGGGFIRGLTEAQLAPHRRQAEAGLEKAEAAARSDRYDLIVLDEICVAIARGLVSEARVAELIRHARPGLCLVLTGRDAPAGLVALADTVTDMRAVRHGYERGIPAQQGVEW